MRLLVLFASLLVSAIAQTHRASDVADFISVDAPVFVLDHVRVIDGTGTPAKEDQAVVIANGKIQFIGPDASTQVAQGAQRIERSGYTVIPGLVQGAGNPPLCDCTWVGSLLSGASSPRVVELYSAFDTLEPMPTIAS